MKGETVKAAEPLINTDRARAGIVAVCAVGFALWVPFCGEVIASRAQVQRATAAPVVENEFVKVDRTEAPTVETTVIADCIIGESHGEKFTPTHNAAVIVRLRAPSAGADSGATVDQRIRVGYVQPDGVFGCSVPLGWQQILVLLKSQPAKAAFGDDAVKLDPKHNEILFDNELVRVVRVHFGPGESGPMVDKRTRVIIMLTDSHATVTLPDGHSEVRDGKAGTVSFSKGGRQATNNVGTTELENIVVELKGK